MTPGMTGFDAVLYKMLRDWRLDRIRSFKPLIQDTVDCSLTVSRSTLLKAERIVCALALLIAVTPVAVPFADSVRAYYKL